MKVKKRIFAALACAVTAALALAACTPKDLKYDGAIRYAKNNFGCDKILWIKSNGALILGDAPGSEGSVYKLRSHYAFYVVGEKDGEEVYIVIPSTPALDEPYYATWAFDHTFSQIVDKLNERGAGYVADVPDDYYSVAFEDYIDFIALGALETGARNELAHYYSVGCSGDEFYDRLDVKAVFSYEWEEGGVHRSCIVSQEGGELKSYDALSAAE